MSLVAVDVGGTNVRFAIAGEDGLSHHHSMLGRDFPTLEAAFLAYQERIDQPVTADSELSPERRNFALGFRFATECSEFVTRFARALLPGVAQVELEKTV